MYKVQPQVYASALLMTACCCPQVFKGFSAVCSFSNTYSFLSAKLENVLTQEFINNTLGCFFKIKKSQLNNHNALMSSYFVQKIIENLTQ